MDNTLCLAFPLVLFASLKFFLSSAWVKFFDCFSTDDEEEGLQDEPEPETKKNIRAKDDLNAFSMSDSEEEEVEDELTTVGKELKEMLKREAGDESSLDEDEDEDIDESEKYSKSALFMPGEFCLASRVVEP